MTEIIFYLITGFLTILPPTNEWKENNLIGNVKSMKEYGSTVDPRDKMFSVPEDSNYELFEFSKDGKITNRATCKSDGKKISIAQYTYDQDGHRTSLTWLLKDTVFTKYTYAYQDNDVIEWYEEGKGQNKQKTQYIYDKDGRMVEENLYSGGGGLHYKLKKEYDSKGNLITLTQYDSNNKYESKYTYTYDNHRNPHTETYSSADGFMNGTTSYAYEYDKKGNWIKRVKYDRHAEPFFVKERKIEYY